MRARTVWLLETDGYPWAVEKYLAGARLVLDARAAIGFADSVLTECMLVPIEKKRAKKEM